LERRSITGSEIRIFFFVGAAVNYGSYKFDADPPPNQKTMTTLDPKKWKGFIFTQGGALQTRMERSLSDENAKRAGVKTLSTVCRQHRIYFQIEFYIEKSCDHVSKLLEEAYGGMPCVFNLDDPIMNITFREDTTTYQSKTWPDEISGSVVMIPEFFDERGKVLTVIMHHIMHYTATIENNFLAAFIQHQKLEFSFKALEETNNANAGLVKVLEDENKKLNEQMQTFMHSYNQKSSVDRENQDLKRRVMIAETNFKLSEAKNTSLLNRIAILEQQLASHKGALDARISQMETKSKLATKFIQNETVKWTETAMGRARMMDTTKSSQTFGMKRATQSEDTKDTKRICLPASEVVPP